MPTRNKATSALIVGNLPEVFTNLKIRSSTTYRIVKDGFFYVKGDEVIPEEEFEKQHPIAFKPVRKHGANVDSTKFE